ncbi:PEP-utilizing enzyme [Nannocystaceae bacterium ST9]
MSFELGQPPDRADLARFPKVARQHALAARGLPVPDGVVLDLVAARLVFAAHEAGRAATEQEVAMRWVRARLAEGARLIARSSRGSEDGETHSGAGLGMSVAGIANLRELEGALALIEIHGRTLSPEPEPTMILIQREIPRRALLVVVRGGAPDDRFYVEVHGPGAGPEPLAEGRSPDWSGGLTEWPDPSRGKVEALAASVAASEGGAFGADLEIVVDLHGEPWLVQARPLTAPLHPGWPGFVDALRDEGLVVEELRGRLTLDGEHNPAPLSPAHAWVMRRLGVLRPGKAGDPVILAGWLYMRALPRELGDTLSEPLEVHEALTWLRDEALPRARAALQMFDALVIARPAIRTALERAEALFVGMIDEYVGTLVPARRAALHRIATQAPGFVPQLIGTPTTLRERGSFLDVLPAVWDIASPNLGELLAGTRPSAADERELPRDEALAARLLGEWDDHLFALGLAPLRRLWLYAADRLGLAREHVFLLRGDELIRLDEDPTAFGPPHLLGALLESRSQRWARQHEIDPPTRIVDGAPLPHPVGGLLRGLAVGEPFSGVVAQRRDLRDLLADPPPIGAVLCMPALTAQAAVALHELGIRAVCTEYGGALAHGVLMARELGLSALIGCRGCTRVPEGTAVYLDTRARKLWC